MIRYRFRFSKQASNNYTNSLDLVKKILVSNFELANNGKKYKFSLGPALPFGWESECEYLDAVFVKREDISFIRDLVEKNLPSDLKLVEIKTIPLHFPSIESACDVVEIILEGEKKFCDLVFESAFVSFVYDCFESDSGFHLLLYYKKISREVVKNIIDFLSTYVKINRIVRKNLYWIDLEGNLRKF